MTATDLDVLAEIDSEEEFNFLVLTTSNFDFKGIAYEIPDAYLTNEEYREVHGDCRHMDVEVIDEEDDHGSRWHVWVCRDCRQYNEALALPIWDEE